MSRDASMQMVARACPKELEGYFKCVAAHPEQWNTKCSTEKSQVAECASKHPLIQRIKDACGAHHKVYVTCLNEHMDNVEKCTKLLETFSECADKMADSHKS